MHPFVTIVFALLSVSPPEPKQSSDAMSVALAAARYEMSGAGAPKRVLYDTTMTRQPGTRTFIRSDREHQALAASVHASTIGAAMSHLRCRTLGCATNEFDFVISVGRPTIRGDTATIAVYTFRSSDQRTNRLFGREDLMRLVRTRGHWRVVDPQLPGSSIS
jgi:hypothetical protein